MLPWLGLDRLWFFLLRLFLNWCTRANVLPDTLDELGIQKDKPLFYVLQDTSTADLLVTDKEAAKLGLPSLLDAVPLGKQQLNRAWFSVYKRNYFRRRQRQVANPKRLTQLVDLLAENTALDVQLLPASVFWGRRPDKENSLWKIIFSDNWSPAGLVKKIIIVITQGRQLYVQFSPAMSLRQLVDETTDRERILRKTSRILRVHFRRQREASIGPDLSHRRMLVDTIVQSIPVRAAIERQAQVDNTPLAKAEAQARHYALELAADYSHTVIRFLEILLNWVWNRIFDGIRVYNLDRLRQVAKENEVVYVPCHRSHVDYLLMSFLLYRNGLVPPHIAAGINLNLPVVGTILRRGGAFFMRRSFKGKPLYAAVFNEYMHTILTRGYPIEYFVEGSRSRSGRMLPPRTGMLAMTVESYLREDSKPIAFVPVYVGYEKVIEAASYIGELDGKTKKKESVGGLLGSLGILRNHWGQVHVNIGEPVRLPDFLDQRQPGWRDGDQTQWLRSLVSQLGVEVTSQINAAAVANPINLLSLALLATDKHTIDEQLLTCQLGLYVALLQQAPYSSASVLTETDPRAIIDYALAHGFAFRIDHPHGNLISTDQATALQMTYVRNNTLHLFALPGLISSLFLHARSLESARLHSLIQLLYPFLRSEYSLHWQPGVELNQAVDTLLAAMESQHLLVRDGEYIVGAPTHTLEADQLFHLGKTVLQMQERLFLTIRILVQHGAGELKASDLQQQAQQSAQRLSLLHEFNSPDFFDMTVFKSLVAQLQKHGLVETDTDGKLQFDNRLLALDEESNHILSAETRLALQRLARSSGV
jgi:glycerol-3-phosphate O-acyltransferase